MDTIYDSYTIRLSQEKYLNKMYFEILDKPNFEESYSILQKMNFNDRVALISLIINKWIEKYLNNPDDISINEQCKFFISCMDDKDICNLIINNTSDDINKLKKILLLIDNNFIKKYKSKLFFNNIECLDYIINNYGHYDKSTINYILYNMSINYYYVNENIVDWIINNYDNFIKNNIDNIIIDIMKSTNYANVKNSYMIIDKLLKIENLDSSYVFNIFKKSIHYSNAFTFELFLHNYYDTINIINMFEFVCIYTNPNISIFHSLVPYVFNLNEKLHTYNFSCLYNKVKEMNIMNVVKWFETYFDNNLKLLLNEPVFMTVNINIKKEHCDKECIICYENNNNMISLGCCSNHITCSSCLKQWYNNNTTCPMCRQDVIFEECNLYLI
jgi:hypothetical protein